MPYRGCVFAQGLYYHIYNRGAGKQPIFFNAANYEYLLRLVHRYSPKYGAKIIAYCWMPNHYHFLLRQETDEPLSKFINVLFNTYVQAVNLEQGRSGTLFEGRFRHVCVDRYEYLIQLCRYIHNNPRKAGLVASLEDWPYSNYLEWIGLRNGILKDDAFIEQYFPGTRETYRQFVDELKEEMQVGGDMEGYFLD
jgi:putative transposase